MMSNKKTIPHIKNSDKVILYDGVCKLCHAWCQFIIQHDQHNIFKFSPMQSKKGQDIVKYLNLPTENFETFLFVENNVVYDKSTAFIKILQQLPSPIKFFVIFKYIPKFFRDTIYIRIAHKRYKWFGKYNKCCFPQTKRSSRFL